MQNPLSRHWDLHWRPTGNKLAPDNRWAFRHPAFANPRNTANVSLKLFLLLPKATQFLEQMTHNSTGSAGSFIGLSNIPVVTAKKKKKSSFIRRACVWQRERGCLWEFGSPAVVKSVPLWELSVWVSHESHFFSVSLEHMCTHKLSIAHEHILYTELWVRDYTD